jgi:hypothetical protein
MSKDIRIEIVVASGMSEVKKEGQFQYLNEVGFRRTVSAGEQWLLLVNDAWKATNIPPNTIIRDYLAFMLGRYLLRNDLYERLAEFNFFYQLLEKGRIDPAHMQEFAEISLMYVSFVPGRSSSRREPRKLKYTSELGESLFQQLSLDFEGEDDWFSVAFKEMAQFYGRAVMVLRSVKAPHFRRNVSVLEEALMVPSDREAQALAQKYLMNTQVSGKPH